MLHTEDTTELETSSHHDHDVNKFWGAPINNSVEIATYSLGNEEFIYQYADDHLYELQWSEFMHNTYASKNNF